MKVAEVWRQVDFGDGRYSVSDQGNVRTNGAPLKLRLNKTGYLVTALWDPATGKSKRRFVHNLVLEAFVGPKPEGLVTGHGDVILEIANAPVLGNIDQVSA